MSKSNEIIAQLTIIELNQKPYTLFFANGKILPVKPNDPKTIREGAIIKQERDKLTEYYCLEDVMYFTAEN